MERKHGENVMREEDEIVLESKAHMESDIRFLARGKSQIQPK